MGGSRYIKLRLIISLWILILTLESESSLMDYFTHVEQKRGMSMPPLKLHDTEFQIRHPSIDPFMRSKLTSNNQELLNKVSYLLRGFVPQDCDCDSPLDRLIQADLLNQLKTNDEKKWIRQAQKFRFMYRANSCLQKATPLPPNENNYYYLAFTILYAILYLPCTFLITQLDPELIHHVLTATVGLLPTAVGIISSLLHKRCGKIKETSSDSNPDESHDISGEWMFDPEGPKPHDVEIIACPAFQRLATYRLCAGKLPDNVSPLNLAEAGFLYTGNGSFVQCEDCGMEVRTSNFTSCPKRPQYHLKGCKNIDSSDVVGDFETCSAASLGCQNDDEESNSSFQSCESEFDEGFGDHIETDSAEISPNPAVHVPSAAYGEDASSDKEPWGSNHATSSFSAESAKHVANPAAASSNPSSNDTTSVAMSTGGQSQAVASSIENGSGPDRGKTHLSVPSRTKPSSETHPGGNASIASHRERTASSSTTSSASSGYSSIATNDTSSLSSSRRSSNAADTFVDDGFVDLETYEPEAEIDPPRPEEIPPVITIQCEKNKGHYAYFPIRQLELKYIPSDVRYNEVLQFLKLISGLTVRIVVRETSRRRPQDECTQNHRIVGTGSCFQRDAEIIQNSECTESGKLNTVRRLMQLGKKQKHGRIYIETNRHIVFDEEEAQNTVVEFFFDHPNRRDVVTVKGLSVQHSRVHGDNKSILVCKTSNLSLVERVNQMRKDMRSMVDSFPQNVKEGLLRKIFIIGHPHGGEKVLSYGDSVVVKYAVTEIQDQNSRAFTMVKIYNHQQVTDFGKKARKVLLYTADTCRGSSGAPIITFKASNARDNIGSDAGAEGGLGDFEMDMWMHNGVDKKHGLGGSVMRELTAEDIAHHGKPSGTRSYAQDNMSRNNGGDGQSSFTQVPSCPVFTVVGHPSYPAYVAYQSRLDSYNEWRHHHIHLPVHLAEAGFFYAGYADCVRCFQCGLGLRTWKEGDDVYVEHYKSRPNCQFLQMQLRVRGINDPETQLRPQPRGDNAEQRPRDSRNDSTGHQTRLSEMANPSVVVQPSTLSTDGCGEGQMSHSSGRSELDVMTDVKHLADGLSSFPVPPQQAVVGYASSSTTQYPVTKPENVTNQVMKDQDHVEHTVEAERKRHESKFGTDGEGACERGRAGRDGKSLTMTLLERENRFLQQQLTCKVCFRNPIKDLFLPCGELYACTDCSKLLSHCPSCKKQILATVTTYFT